MTNPMTFAISSSSSRQSLTINWVDTIDTLLAVHNQPGEKMRLFDCGTRLRLGWGLAN